MPELKSASINTLTLVNSSLNTQEMLLTLTPAGSMTIKESLSNYPVHKFYISIFDFVILKYT